MNTQSVKPGNIVLIEGSDDRGRLIPWTPDSGKRPVGIVRPAPPDDSVTLLDPDNPLLKGYREGWPQR